MCQYSGWLAAWDSEPRLRERPGKFRWEGKACGWERGRIQSRNQCADVLKLRKLPLLSSSATASCQGQMQQGASLEGASSAGGRMQGNGQRGGAGHCCLIHCHPVAPFWSPVAMEVIACWKFQDNHDENHPCPISGPLLVLLMFPAPFLFTHDPKARLCGSQWCFSNGDLPGGSPTDVGLNWGSWGEAFAQCVTVT